MNNPDKAHPTYLGWQMDWPLYVKVPFLTMFTKTYHRGDYFPWSEVQADPEKIAVMYRQGMLYHDAYKAVEDGAGDRLGEISGRDLTSITGLLNTELKKKHCATETEFKRKRCRSSSLPDVQRRYIRQFLAKNPYMGDYFKEIREMYIKKPVETPAENVE